MTPEIVAKKLTDTQRRALLWLPADGSERHEDKTPHLSVGMWGLKSKKIAQDIEAHLVTHRSEMRMVDGQWPRPYWRATKLGLAVRAVLEAGSG